MRRPVLAIAAALLVTVGCQAQAQLGPASPSTTIPAAATSLASAPSRSASAAQSAPATPTSFSSPLYGYSVALPAGWTATAATMYADDPASTGDTATDMIKVPGTDTMIGILAWDLGSGTYEAWAKAYHDDVVANVPQGCDGGDPSTWPSVPVGPATGHRLMKCNEVEVMVPIGKRVYVFTWGHDTFQSSRHLPEPDFEAFLQGVTLPGAEVTSRPLWSAPPGPTPTAP